MIEAMRAQGCNIKATIDRDFLARQPLGRRNMRRVGQVLGTGSYGRHGYTIYAYRDVVAQHTQDPLDVFTLARALDDNVVNDHIVKDENQ